MSKYPKPNAQQLEHIEAAGLKRHGWVVLQDLRYGMLIRHRSGEVKLIDKKIHRK